LGECQDWQIVSISVTDPAFRAAATIGLMLRASSRSIVLENGNWCYSYAGADLVRHPDSLHDCRRGRFGGVLAACSPSSERGARHLGSRT